MATPAAYPELLPFLADDIDEVAVRRVDGPDGAILVVTATAEDSTDQFVFGRTPDGLVDLTGHQSRLFALDLLGAFQGPADVATHDKALKAARDAVDVFQTSDGPGGGALACVWSLRTILHDALGYWVTRTDGTEDFGAELQGDYRKVFGEPDVLPGGIVISPTQVQAGTKKRIVGHVGILGAGAGDARKIYSNSSRRKVWSQNYTVATWKAYQLPRGLDVLFYPLPMIR